MEAKKTSEYNFSVLPDTKMSSRKDFKKYLFDKIQDFPGYWEPCKHNQTGIGCRVVENFQVRFYLNDPLCIMAIKQKRKRKRGSVGGMSSINRP